MKKQNNKKRKIIYIICIIIAFGVTAVIVALASRSGGDYVADLVHMEQDEHYTKLRDHTQELSRAFEQLEVYSGIIDERRLTVEEKEDIGRILRDMEEAGLNISRRNMFYVEDTTVHMFFAPEQKIIDYFDEARNTQLYIERCVRFAEAGLSIPYPTKTQKDSVREQCGLLADEIERLKKYIQ